MAEANALDVCRLRAAPAEREGGAPGAEGGAMCVPAEGRVHMLGGGHAATAGRALRAGAGRRFGSGSRRRRRARARGGGRGVRVVASVSGVVASGLGGGCTSAHAGVGRS
eukprot:scaffold70491_cov43-Phaeocystis_antarctica.AAC.3